MPIKKPKNFFIKNYQPQVEKSKKTEIKEINEKKEPKEKIEKIERYSKKKLSVIYFILIGIEKTIKILKKFSNEEISIIIKELLKIDKIPEEEIYEAEKVFGTTQPNELEQFTSGIKYAHLILQKLFGMEKGSKLFVSYIEDNRNNILSFIEDLPVKSISNILKEESEMVSSIILGLMDSKKVAEILNNLPKDKSINILKRMSKKIEISPYVLDTILDKLKQKVSRVEPTDTIKISGKDKLIEILKNSKLDDVEKIINNLEELEPDLADELKEKMFAFDDLVSIPKKSLIIALKDYNDNNIAFILKGATDLIKEIIFSCVSKKRKIYIKDEMEYLGKVKKSDVDEKRKDFINYLRKLEDEEKIILKTENETYVE